MACETEKEKIMCKALTVIANIDLDGPVGDELQFATSRAHEALDDVAKLDCSCNK